LEKPFEDDEVFKVVKALNGDKASGWFYYGFFSSLAGRCLKQTS
jgi:hypothetical protein